VHCCQIVLRSAKGLKAQATVEREGTITNVLAGWVGAVER